MSLKAYKAAVKVGAVVTVLEHWNPEWVGSKRTVTKVQGDSFASLIDGEKQPIWSPFPKAVELQFDGHIAKVRVNDAKFWTLKIEQGTPV